MTESGIENVSTQWRRLEAWLSLNSPGDYETLQIGATKEEITHIESELTYNLHPSLKELFSLRNGVRKRKTSLDPGAFLLNYNMLSSYRALEEHRLLESMIRDAADEGVEDAVVGMLAHTHWVPFAETFSGSILFMDHRPGEGFGKVGEINSGDPECVLLWENLEAMLSEICDALEAWAPLSRLPLMPTLTGDGHLQWGYQ